MRIKKMKLKNVTVFAEEFPWTFVGTSYDGKKAAIKRE